MRLAQTFRRMTRTHWLGFYALILVSWVVLFLSAVPSDIRSAGLAFGADFWAGFCVVTPDAGGYLRVVVMWALMSAAMMAPTAFPAFAVFDDLNRAGRGGFAAIVAGYLAVWLGFSLIAAATQFALVKAELLNPFGDSRSAILSGVLLLIAGLYQFSPIKEGCLSKCRLPMAFFMQHWQPGAGGAWRMGLRLGADCLGCCWALMALAFVGGVMNLAFMGLATLIMVLEKLPDIGRPLTKPLGVVLILTAGVVGARAMLMT